MMIEGGEAQPWEEILDLPFDSDRFRTRLIAPLCPLFKPSKSLSRGGVGASLELPLAFERHIHSMYELGVGRDSLDEELPVWVISTHKSSTLIRRGATLRHAALFHLARAQYRQAIVVYISNEDQGRRWWLSWVTFAEDRSVGHPYPREDEMSILSAHRYSFRVGVGVNTLATRALLARLCSRRDVSCATLDDTFKIDSLKMLFFERVYLLIEELSRSPVLADGLKASGEEPRRWALRYLQRRLFIYCARSSLNDDSERPLNLSALDPLLSDLEPPLVYSNHIRDLLNQVDFSPLEAFIYCAQEPMSEDREAVIDPEMLGDLFEDSLTRHRRRDQGVYYTPREIVRFMCRESLSHLLYTHARSTLSRGGEKSDEGESRALEDAIKALIYRARSISNQEVILRQNDREIEAMTDSSPLVGLIDAERLERPLIERLYTLRVCDPAVGSGAYPLMFYRTVMATYEALSTIAQSPPLRSLSSLSYDLLTRLHCVDINPDAVALTRMRLWLALLDHQGAVVDEIRCRAPLCERLSSSLPRLTFQVVCGNALNVSPPLAISTHQALMVARFKRKYFDASSSTERADILDHLRIRYPKALPLSLRDHALSASGEHPDDPALLFDLRSAFIDIWTPESGGFDLLIGNPPYHQYTKARKREVKGLLESPIYHKALGGRANAYKFFLAQSLSLLKGGGLLAMLFQNNFLADASAQRLRRFFLTKQSVLRLDSFPERDRVSARVFPSAKMSVLILFSKNTPPPSDHSFSLAIWSSRDMSDGRSIRLSYDELERIDPKGLVIPSLDQRALPLLKKLSGLPRLHQAFRCLQGEINLSIHRPYLSDSPTIDSPLVLKGAEVQRWRRASVMSQGQRVYLLREEYLAQYRGAKSQHHRWPRLVMQGITGVDEPLRLKATWIDEGIFCAHSVNYISLKGIDDEVALYTLAVLNSDVFNWFFKVFSTNSNVNSYEIHALPYLPYRESFRPISILSRALLSRGSHHLETTGHLEAVLQGLIFELYFGDEFEDAQVSIFHEFSRVSSRTDDVEFSLELDQIYERARGTLDRIDSIESVKLIKSR